MAVRVTQVRYTADTKAATTSIKTVERELDVLTAKANKSLAASRAAKGAGAGLGGPGSGLEIGRKKVELGAFEFGSKGFQLNAGYMRGAFGSAMSLGIGTRLVAGGINTFQDIKEKLQEWENMGYSTTEKITAVLGAVEKSAIQFFTTLFGVDTLGKAVLRGAGYTDAGTEKLLGAIEDTFDSFYDPRAVQARQKARSEAQWAKEEQIWQLYNKSMGELKTILPKTFRLRSPADVKTYRNEIQNGKIAGADGLSNSELLENDLQTRLRVSRLNPGDGR